MILDGYLKRKISEKEFRNYYLRSIYKRRFEDKRYQTKSIPQVLIDLGLEYSNKINISALIAEYNDAKAFREELQPIGLWTSNTHFDTLYFNGNPIRMSQDQIGAYYIEYLYEDGSCFSRILHRSSDNTFTFFPKSKSYFKILSNGDLEIVNGIGEKKRYTKE